MYRYNTRINADLKWKMSIVLILFAIGVKLIREVEPRELLKCSNILKKLIQVRCLLYFEQEWSGSISRILSNSRIAVSRSLYMGPKIKWLLRRAFSLNVFVPSGMLIFYYQISTIAISH